ncbi:MAG: HAD family phosphatase [Acidobacteria bacterium]|nr:HAD family phosphatase [Acidobacteriota bacterium]
MSEQRRAAFFDLDGTLLDLTLVHTYAYYARNQRSIVNSLYRFSKVVASVPLLLLLDFYSRRVFNIYHFSKYKGMDRDRLIALAEDLFATVVKPSIYPGSDDLVQRTRDAGFRTVLITGTLDFTVDPIAQHFGFHEVICNHLEFVNHIATGRVVPPLIAESEKARAIREYCEKKKIDPRACSAYSDSYSDLPMLNAVGHPVATNPDKRLKRVALAQKWPIIDLGSSARESKSVLQAQGSGKFV